MRKYYMQVGHMQPVAWFRFHNRRDHKRWAELSEPKTVWEGADSDLNIRRSWRENSSTRGASPKHPGALSAERLLVGAQECVHPHLRGLLHEALLLPP